MAKKIPVNYDTSREFSKKSTGQSMVSNGQTTAKKMLSTATPTVSQLFQTAGGTTGSSRTLQSSGSTTGNAKDTMVDPTKQKQATTQQDVDDQDWRTRLWQSLETTYGALREASDKKYDLAYNQADRQATSRGMGRSSYNNATLANLSQEKVKAGNQIYAEQIADYQNRVTEQEEKEWQKQFQQAQLDWDKEKTQKQLDWEREHADQLNEQWKQEYDEKKRQFDEQMAYEKERSKASDEQWQQEYNEKKRQFDEQMALEREKFNFQKSQAATSGGGGGGTGNPTQNPENPNTFDPLALALKSTGTSVANGLTGGATSLVNALKEEQKRKAAQAALEKYQKDGRQRTADLKS